MNTLSTRHENFSLRFMGVSAPQWISKAGVADSYSLDSRTPFSLQNALRIGVGNAQKNCDVWKLSNWSNSGLVEDSIFLMNYFHEDQQFFIERLQRIKPHILFIGAMTLCYPGAIALAKIAKELLGENVFIVLGGKHPTETIYQEKGIIKHHAGSPVMHMLKKDIPEYFDLVISGDGEDIIEHIGRIYGQAFLSDVVLPPISTVVDQLTTCRGQFIISWIENGEVHEYANSSFLDYESLPSPVSLFGTNTKFNVFQKDYTAHVYSDMGKGCVFNCFFCSERSAINGKMSHHKNPAKRLYRQLEDALKVNSSMSAFIEDSIMLSGNPVHLSAFADLLESQPLDITFGGQFIIDNLLNEKIQELIIKLKKVGLSYIYIGMETSNEDVASRMSKNTKRRKTWVDRNEQAIEFLSSQGIECGVSILWGLGESQEDRIGQLTLIHSLQGTYSNLSSVSLNWATQHPLFNQSEYSYIDWGTGVDSPYLPYFIELFGEASERYCINRDSLPSLKDLEVLRGLYRQLQLVN